MAAETAEAQPERGEVVSRLSKHMKALHRYISSQVMRAMLGQLQDDDLSFSQMSALHQLRTYAPMSVGGLAERIGLSLPAASHLTDKLVVRGYAQRRENPEDRRAKLLDLSERGQQILEEMDKRFSDTYRVAFSRISLQTLQATTDSLETLLQELLTLGPDSGPDGCMSPEAAAATQTSHPHSLSRPSETAAPVFELSTEEQA
ncbi:MarR family transcriptional regulator [Deinococcus radiomollis]|uniref:MarR family transcriptional regulator n=1 Tax=Deinococcus radiomollis TaxID=468916 RepID=UPI0038929383